MTEPGDPGLSEAVRAIAAGEPVDWPGIDGADPEAARLATSLREVASIVAFHRGLHQVERTPAEWGPLRILEELGRGAYGRVYRAVDPRVDREVALKILEQRGTADTETANATVDEARLLARLKHSNIVAVHGADCINGQVGLWMEFIAGETLDDIVRERGPLSADEAVVIGRDVCKAVAAIHRAGLIHRDIKAQNVMRERGGRIVLMDFGAGRETVNLPAASLAGTPLYLAPEIIAGGQVTHHADLYSVGVLLYFLVTGTFPVDAATLGALKEAHVMGHRNRLRDTRADLPAPFIDVVERALAPDSAERFQSAGALEAALSDALAIRESQAQEHKSSRVGALAAAALLAIAATLVAAQALTPRVAAPITARFSVPVDGDRLFQAAVSPDGREVVYEVRGTDTVTRLYRRRVHELTAVPIPGVGHASYPFFSADGKWIGFNYLESPQTLRKLPATGGPAVTLASWPDAAGATWDATEGIVYADQDNLWRILDHGDGPSQLTRLPPVYRAADPRVLRNGTIVFTRLGVSNAADLVALSRDGRISIVLSGARNGRFLSPDILTFIQGKWIMAARFDPEQLRLTRPPVEIQPRGFGNWFDVSETGTFVDVGVTRSDVNALPRFVWIDRYTGTETELPLPPKPYIGDSSTRLSPDGRQIVVATASSPEALGEGDMGRLWIGDIATGRLTPFTNDEAQLISWSPDGSRLVYVNSRGALAWRNADQSAAEREIADPAALPRAGCAYGSLAAGTNQMIMRCWGRGGGDLHSVTLPGADAHGAATVAPFLATPFGEGHPTISPDGKWVAYQSHETGEQQIWVQELSTRSRLRLTTYGGNLPIWKHGEIFYMGLNPRLPMVIPVIDTAKGRTFGAPRQVLPSFKFERGSSFDVSPDGRRFLVMRGARSSGATQLNIVLNWIAEVRQKLAK